MLQRLRGLRLAIAMLAATAMPAFAQSIGAGQTAPGNGPNLGKSVPERNVHPGEHLAMPMFPAGWVRSVAQSGPIEIYEYMPKSQTPSTWRDKVILEIHRGSNTLPIDAYQRRALGMTRENCEGVFEGQLQTGVNNGFPAAYWTLGCKRDKRGNWGEVRYTKAIQGGETLYILTRAWRTASYGDNGPPLQSAVIEEGRNFLGTSVVCVPGIAKHPCPASDKSPESR